MIRVALFIAIFVGLGIAGTWFIEAFPTATLIIILAAFAGAWVGTLAWVWKR
jgi:hypothetical protein